ncbi:hypothetical protein [Pinibacter aurantiacus]|uniref:Uncharacterized protein n=1 Tax=Pinibacter aurantiacus TaxID=2851599 RepID=A0A9E2W7U2_9BACT|nr:hypothetical protein [Pinibacter aurantiacus]MBV4356882.1 hypothetical protein [Pinibacter aurantiacus]
MFLFVYSLEELNQPDILAAVSLLILLILLTIIILIVRKVRRKKEPDNVKELEFAAQRKQTTIEELDDAQYLLKENVNTFVEPPSNFQNENSIPMNMNLDLNLQVEALEKEAIEIKESLFRMKGAIGKDDEYRELKEKWYEKERQLRELRNADKSSSFVTNGFIHHEKENNTETAVHLSTEYYETSDESQEHNDAETLTMYNAPISEQPNTISEKDKETKKLHDKIAQLEELPRILSEKNRLLLQELETLKAAHRQLEERYAHLESTQNKKAEQAPTGTNCAHTNETSQTPAATNTEIKNLQDKITELESLTPVLTEKNLLIEFLQNQLDKQIKNTFQVEKELTQLKAETLQANEAFQQRQTLADQIQEELQKKEQYNILITSQYEKAVQVTEKYKQQLDETIEKLSSLQAHLRNTIEHSRNSE